MLRSSLAYGMAMVPGDFAGSLTPLVTRGILTVSKSVADTGILGIATRLTQPLTIMRFAFQTAFNPIYFSLRKRSTAAEIQSLAVTAHVWALAIFGALWRGIGGTIGSSLVAERLSPGGKIATDRGRGFFGNGHQLFVQSRDLLQQADMVGAGRGLQFRGGRYYGFLANRRSLWGGWRGLGNCSAGARELDPARNRLPEVGQDSAPMVQPAADHRVRTIAGSVPLWNMVRGRSAEFAIGVLGVGVVSDLVLGDRRFECARRTASAATACGESVLG